MLSYTVVVALVILSSFSSAAGTAVFFLIRHLNSEGGRARYLAEALSSSYQKGLSTLRESNLSLERVADNYARLEERRIDSRRTRTLLVKVEHELAEQCEFTEA